MNRMKGEVASARNRQYTYKETRGWGGGGEGVTLG